MAQDPTCASRDIRAREIAGFEEELGSGQRIAELELENSRLRRFVTDLLLEKVELGERAGSNDPRRHARNRKLR